jgi:hypothetical protein
MVSIGSNRRRTLVVAVASVSLLLTLVLMLATVLLSRSKTATASNINICRVYAVDVLMADRYGNLQGPSSGSDDYFECERAVLVKNNNSDSDNNSDNNSNMVEQEQDDVYFTVHFSKAVVAANAVALEQDEWFVQYELDHVHGNTLVFSSDYQVVSVSPDQVERRLFDAHAAAVTEAANRNGNRGLLRLWNDQQVVDNQEQHTAPPSLSVRRHLVTEETRDKVIIVRITTADRNVIYSAEELAQFVFGDDDDLRSNSLRAQYRACSHRAVDLQPYDADNPVLEVQVEYGVEDYTFDDVFREANPIVKQLVGGVPLGDIVQHVMYVVPAGLGGSDGGENDFEAVSVASVNHFKGIYSDRYFGQIGVLLHQTAHNKGLGHAWRGGDEYGDTTGAMGKGEPGVEKVCFNGLHANYLEWMTDKTTRVDAMVGETRIEMISFVDYDRAFEGQVAILIVEPYYLTYNLKKGFNSETLELEDEVLIVQREGNIPDSIATNLIASLHPTKNVFFTREAFFSSGENLVIEVCEVFQSETVGDAPDSITLAVGTIPTPCQPQPSAAPSVTVSSAPSVAMSSAPSPTPITRPKGWYIPIYDKESTHFLGNDDTACEDSLDITFYMNDTLGHQRCSWLRRNLNGMHDANRSNKEAFCVESENAFYFCEETCGKCTDDCNDNSTATFQLAGSYTNCEWLSGKPFLWTLACKHRDVWEVCRDTCDCCGDQCDDLV